MAREWLASDSCVACVWLVCGLCVARVWLVCGLCVAFVWLVLRDFLRSSVYGRSFWPVWVCGGPGRVQFGQFGFVAA